MKIRCLYIKYHLSDYLFSFTPYVSNIMGESCCHIKALTIHCLIIFQGLYIQFLISVHFVQME
jgi:hypothetical protein